MSRRELQNLSEFYTLLKEEIDFEKFTFIAGFWDRRAGQLAGESSSTDSFFELENGHRSHFCYHESVHVQNLIQWFTFDT